jgi:hypothetical protein
VQTLLVAVRMTKSISSLVVVALTAGAGGCMLGDEPDLEVGIGEEQELTPDELVLSAGGTAGCQAIYAREVSIATTLSPFDPAFGNQQLQVGRWELKLLNSTNTPCTSFTVHWQIVETGWDFLEYLNGLTTSLGAHKSRRVWVGNVGYDSAQSLPTNSNFELMNWLDEPVAGFSFHELYRTNIATR